jgi:hypothetical protein
MRVRTIAIALTISAGLTACGEAEPLRTVDTGCLVFKPIRYANAPTGQVDDPGNKFDSAETIAEIDEHDAVYERLCATPPPL